MNLDAYRLAKENDLTAVDYYNLMMDNVDEVSDKRLQALKEIEKDKLRVAWAYNKKVRAKPFQVGELVWKTILPLWTKSNKFGKWSPCWEGPYKIVKVIFGNSYMVETLKENVYPGLWMEDTWKNTTQVFSKTLEDEDGRYLDIALSIIFRPVLEL